jgi:iron complex outermembrane receptor protein
MGENMRLKHLITGTASAIALSAVAFSGTAFAQAAPQTGDQSGTIFGEIVVTAQKREQRLQDVPVAVTVVNAQLLSDAGVKDIKDLTILTPGLIVTSSSSEASTTARIRGIGTVGDNPGLESSVGVVVDGIYRPRNGVALTDLGELSRVEVLKGPQGTLFGKNATAGVINVVTAGPSFTPGIDAEISGGNFGDERATVSLTGPLVADKLAGRLFIGAENRDGYQSVVTGLGPRTKTDDGDRDFGTVRGQLLWLPSNQVDVRIIGDYTRRNENCCTAVPLVNGNFAGPVTNNPGLGGPNILNPVNPFNRVTYANRSTTQNTTDYGGSVEANWTTPWFNGAKLTSVTGVRKWHVDQGQDPDFTTLDILYRAPHGQNFTTFDQASEELRLSGDNGRFTWTVGGLVGNEKLISSQTLSVGTQLTSYLDTLLRTSTGATASATKPAPPDPVTGIVPIDPATGLPARVPNLNYIGIETPGPTGGLAYILGGQPNFLAGGTEYDLHHQTDNSYAFFGNTDVHLSDQLTATFGLRYTSEKKTITSHYQNIGGNGTCTVPLITGGATVRSNATGAASGDLTQRLFVGYYCAAFNDSTFNNLTLNEKHDDSEVTGTAKLAWKPSDKLFTYVSYARGFKAGGFNLDRERINGGPPLGLPNGALSPDSNTSFAPETVDSYEGGVKTTWLGGKLLLNAAGFYQDYQDFQLNAFDGIAFTVTSIPKVTTKGVDFDILWQTPVKGLSTQGGITYADTRYGDKLPGYNVPTSAFYISPTPLTVPNGALYRLSGATISFAPLWSASLATTYQHPIGNLMFRSNLSAKYTAKYNTGSDLNPLKENGSMTLVNARIGIGALNDAWSLELWGQNLTDHKYAQVDFDGTLQPNQIDAFLGAPRTYGLTLRFKPLAKR